MRTVSKKRGIVAAVTCAVALGSVGTAIAVSSDGNSPAVPALTGARPVSTSQAELPEGGALRALLAARGGSFDKISSVSTKNGQVIVAEGHLRNGHSTICYQDEAGAGSGGCRDTTLDGVQGPFGGTTKIADDQYQITEVVPATVKSLTIDGDADSSVPVPIANGVATAVVSKSQLGTLHWTNTDGSTGSTNISYAAAKE